MDAGAAIDYARKHGLEALVVSREDETLAQAYGGDFDATTPHKLFSGTKSFWGVTALRARDDGLLDLDEPVAQTIAQYGSDAWKRRVTPRMLLSLTAGYAFGGLGSAVPSYERALAIPLRDEPGSTFVYGGIPLQVFGAFLARKLEPRGLTPVEYLSARVLQPAGVAVASWRELADGTRPLPTGASLSTRNWSAYGRFVLERRTELEECFRPSEAAPRYGLGWWLATIGDLDVVYASGSGGQALYLVPDLDVVAVHFGRSASYKHETLLRRLLGAATAKRRPRAPASRPL